MQTDTEKIQYLFDSNHRLQEKLDRILNQLDPSDSSNYSDDNLVLSKLKSIEHRVGSGKKSISSQLNQVQQTLGQFDCSQDNLVEQLERISCQLNSLGEKVEHFNLDHSDLTDLKNSLRDILVPGVNDTLISISKTIIQSHRNEFLRISKKYQDMDRLLREIIDRLNCLDPSSQSVDSSPVQEFKHRLHEFQETVSSSSSSEIRSDLIQETSQILNHSYESVQEENQNLRNQLVKLSIYLSKS